MCELQESCRHRQHSKKNILIYALQTFYYYFLGLKIGTEHKSMFYRTLQIHVYVYALLGKRALWDSFGTTLKNVALSMECCCRT